MKIVCFWVKNAQNVVIMGKIRDNLMILDDNLYKVQKLLISWGFKEDKVGKIQYVKKVFRKNYEENGERIQVGIERKCYEKLGEKFVKFQGIKLGLGK